MFDLITITAILLGLGMVMGILLEKAWSPKQEPSPYQDIGAEVIVMHGRKEGKLTEHHYRIAGLMKTNRWADAPIEHPVPVSSKHDHEAVCYVLDSLAAGEDRAYLVRKSDCRPVTW